MKLSTKFFSGVSTVGLLIFVAGTDVAHANDLDMPPVNCFPSGFCSGDGEQAAIDDSALPAAINEVASSRPETFDPGDGIGSPDGTQGSGTR